MDKDKLLELLLKSKDTVTMFDIQELVEECDFFMPEKVKNRLQDAIKFHDNLFINHMNRLLKRMKEDSK
jgi:uncharacterized protein YydD (DUF2326 family)